MRMWRPPVESCASFCDSELSSVALGPDTEGQYCYKAGHRKKSVTFRLDQSGLPTRASDPLSSHAHCPGDPNKLSRQTIPTLSSRFDVPVSEYRKNDSAISRYRGEYR